MKAIFSKCAEYTFSGYMFYFRTTSTTASKMAEDFLPPTVRACLNAYIENGDINPEPTTYSIADNKRTVKVEMTWRINQQVRAELDRQCTEYYEQQNREYEREKREKEQQKRQHETETRKVGDYTKVSII